MNLAALIRVNLLRRALMTIVLLAALIAITAVVYGRTDEGTPSPPDMAETLEGLTPSTVGNLVETLPGANPVRSAEEMPTFDFKTAPGDIPAITAERWSGPLAPGYLFVSLFDFNNAGDIGGIPGYTLILDNKGQPVYYFRPFSIPVSVDFKKQPNGLLTFFVPGPANGQFYAMNQNYEIVDQFAAGNGYATDLHELQLLDNGNSLLLIHNSHRADLRQYGGGADVRVIGCTIQEMNADKEVIFEWDSWNHRGAGGIELTDTNQPLDSAPLRYVHCNSVEKDLDGNYLLSSRHLDEITKIDASSGAIIWRMGGKKNQFTFTNDDGFSYQHDARRLSNGRLTVYDNGISHDPFHSRGVEYVVDEINMTVERVAEFRSTPDVTSVAMGNYQALPNGNALVGWGRYSEPMLTEFDPDGNKLLELSTTYPIGTYRAFRFPWRGIPKWPPVLKTELDGTTADLYFSWNGSTETVSYKILVGPNKHDLRQIAAVKRDGFETTYRYELPYAGDWYFRVIPVNENSTNLTPSNYTAVSTDGFDVYLTAVAGGS